MGYSSLLSGNPNIYKKSGFFPFIRTTGHIKKGKPDLHKDPALHDKEL